MGSQRVRHSLATKQQEYDWRVETVGQSDLEVEEKGWRWSSVTGVII